MNVEKTREQYLAEADAFCHQSDPIQLWAYACTINVFRAMLNEVGLNKTLEATRPYNEAWGRAMLLRAKEKLGEQVDDLETLAMAGYYGHSCTSFGHIKPLEIYEGGAICELFSCPNPSMNAPPEMCIVMSHVLADSYSKAINPQYETIYTHHLGNGDDCCRWVLKKKSGKFTINDLGKLERTIPPLDLSLEEMFSFDAEMVVIRELINFTTALIDLVGSNRTMELLLPLARETGLRYGATMKGEVGEKGDLSMIGNKIDILLSYLQAKGQPSCVTGLGMERTITDCPLRGAPPEVCKHLEGVLKGVCEAIDPEYEFAYDRMMSQGDSTCQWTISNRSQPIQIDDHMKVLKMRLAKGEINEDEYKRLKALLE